MSLSKLAGALLLLVVVGRSQDLPPDVLLLARIKSHMREEISHLPNYTCLESIARFRKDPGHQSKPSEQSRKLDTVRLEIVYSDGREWYGSPGGRKLGADNPVEFIGSGMIGTGAFGMTLNNIFEGATFTYRGEEALGDRKAVKYDFRVSRLLKGLEISIEGGIGTVGERGSIWADPHSLDIIRVESRADEIPPFLPLEEASSKVNYARTRIGEFNVLLAQQADLHMLQTSGVESYDRLEFTHCQTYSAQSAIHFGPESPASANPETAAGLVVAGDSSQSIPALLSVTVQLTTPISDTDPVGMLIEGKVSGDVQHKGKVIIPHGSRVRGRIRRLERHLGSGDPGFIVGLEFTEVETRGGLLRFYADLLRIDRSPGIRQTLSERVPMPNGRGGFQTGDATITLPELPGVASFFVAGTTFDIPTGFGMLWRTRGAIR